MNLRKAPKNEMVLNSKYPSSLLMSQALQSKKASTEASKNLQQIYKTNSLSIKSSHYLQNASQNNGEKTQDNQKMLAPCLDDDEQSKVKKKIEKDGKISSVNAIDKAGNLLRTAEYIESTTIKNIADLIGNSRLKAALEEQQADLKLKKTKKLFSIYKYKSCDNKSLDNTTVFYTNLHIYKRDLTPIRENYAQCPEKTPYAQNFQEYQGSLMSRGFKAQLLSSLGSNAKCIQQTSRNSSIQTYTIESDLNKSTKRSSLSSDTKMSEHPYAESKSQEVKVMVDKKHSFWRSHMKEKLKNQNQVQTMRIHRNTELQLNSYNKSQKRLTDQLEFNNGIMKATNDVSRTEEILVDDNSVIIDDSVSHFLLGSQYQTQRQNTPGLICRRLKQAPHHQTNNLMLPHSISNNIQLPLQQFSATPSFQEQLIEENFIQLRKELYMSSPKPTHKILHTDAQNSSIITGVANNEATFTPVMSEKQIQLNQSGSNFNNVLYKSSQNPLHEGIAIRNVKTRGVSANKNSAGIHLRTKTRQSNSRQHWPNLMSAATTRAIENKPDINPVVGMPFTQSQFFSKRLLENKAKLKFDKMVRNSNMAENNFDVIQIQNQIMLQQYSSKEKTKKKLKISSQRTSTKPPPLQRSILDPSPKKATKHISSKNSQYYSQPIAL